MFTLYKFEMIVSGEIWNILDFFFESWEHFLMPSLKKTARGKNSNITGKSSSKGNINEIKLKKQTTVIQDIRFDTQQT